MKRLALWLLLSLGAGRARADDMRAPPPLMRLAPTAAALHRTRTAEREQRLTQLVAALPGIDRAAAQLTIPDPSALPLDQPLPAPRALLVITARAAAASDDALFALAQAVLPALSRSDFTVSRHPPAMPPATPLVRLGPFEVAAGSASPLRIALAASLAMNALLSGFLVWRTAAQRRRARPRTR